MVTAPSTPRLALRTSSPPLSTETQMMTPPSTPRAVSRTSSPPSTKRLFSPVQPETRRSPPLAPGCFRNHFAEALVKHNHAKVSAFVEDDPALLLLPIRTWPNSQNEDPLFYAIRNRCPETIIELLLSPRGAFSAEIATECLIYLAKTTLPSKRRQLEVPLSLPCQSFFDTNVQCAPIKVLQEPTSDAIDDKYEVSVASCLLRFGGKPSRKDCDGVSAEEHARTGDKSGLSKLFEDWQALQWCRLQFHLGVLPLPAGIAMNVYSTLIPESWELAVRSCVKV